jgi:hypothetical protein
MPPNLVIEPGVPYLTLGTAEQVEWVTDKFDTIKHHLLHPTRYEIHTALTFCDPVEEKPRLYIIHPKELAINSEYGLPRDKHLEVCSEYYYFFICALSSGDIKLQEGWVVHDQAEKVKKLAGKPYKILDLRKVNYDFPQTSDLSLRKLYNWHIPYPKSFHRKLKAGLDLYMIEEWEFGQTEVELIESLNQPHGHELWGNISDRQMHSYFRLTQYGTYTLFKEANVDGLSPYLLPFMEQIYNSAVRLSYKAALSQFALWCYFAHKYWADSKNTGLFTYKPKKGNKKLRGVEKAYLFRASQKARTEWLNIIGANYHKIVKGPFRS